jgi:DivIVA domain-containing protein
MPLTPEDVLKKQFTITRLRTGYDETEVDAFLDEVQAELARLIDENEMLRRRIAQITGGDTTTVIGVPDADEATGEVDVTPLAADLLIEPAAPAPASSLSRGPAEVPVYGGATAESAMRLLTVAQRTADDTVEEAKHEAARIVDEAHARANEIDRDAQARHQAVVGGLESLKDRLEGEVGQLRSFAGAFRGDIRSVLERQIDLLDSIDPAAPLSAVGGGAEHAF